LFIILIFSVPQEEFHSFERVLWRSARGNLYMRHAVIEEKIKDPLTGEMARKNQLVGDIERESERWRNANAILKQRMD